MVIGLRSANETAREAKVTEEIDKSGDKVAALKLIALITCFIIIVIMYGVVCAWNSLRPIKTIYKRFSIIGSFGRQGNIQVQPEKVLEEMFALSLAKC